MPLRARSPQPPAAPLGRTDEWSLGDAVRRPATAAAAFGAALAALILAVVIDASSGRGVSVLAVLSFAAAAGALGGVWAELVRGQPAHVAVAIRRLLRLSSAALVVFALVYLFAQRTTYGQEFEREVLLGSGSDLGPFRGGAHAILDQLAAGTVILAGAAACSIAAVRGRMPLALAVGAGVLLTVLSAVVLKEVLLERPVLLGDQAVATARSYPSGHVAAVAALAAAAVVAAPHRLRLAATVAAIVCTSLVGAAVLWVGWHRPSDAVGGLALALGWFGLVAAILVRSGDRTAVRTFGPRLAVPPRLWFLGAYVLAAGAVVFFIAEMGRLRSAVDESPEHMLAFTGGVLVYVAVVLLGFAALSAALPHTLDADPAPGNGG